MSCLFCNIIEKKIPADIVYEDDHTLAFKDIRPIAPTHVLVIPKKHIAAIHDLGDDHGHAMGELMLSAKRVAEKMQLVKGGFRLVANDGEAAGQTVHHIHVHVLGGRAFAWPPG